MNRIDGGNAGRVMLALFFVGALASMNARAACPVEVNFPFLDFDGNLCHDPTDSGDVSAQLLDVTTPFAPPTGSLVCPMGAKLVGSTAAPIAFFYEWSIPDTAVLDCKIVLDRLFVLDAGADVYVGGRLKGQSAVTLESVGGSVELRPGAKVITKKGRILLDATIDVTLGEKAVLKGKTSVLVVGGGVINVADRVKISGSEALLLDGQNVLIGDRVKVVQPGASGLPIQITAEPTVGVISADRVKVKGAGALTIGGGTVTIGAGSLLRYGAQELGRIDAETAITVLDTTILVGFQHFLFTLNTAGTIAVTDSRLRRSASIGDADFETSPGGTCDVTGTTFASVTPTFSGCAQVGP